MSDYEVTVHMTFKIRTTQGLVDARGGTEGFSAAIREYLMDADKVRHFVEHHSPVIAGVAVTVEELHGSAAQPNTVERSSPT